MSESSQTSASMPCRTLKNVGRANSGYTMVELIAVISIIAIMAAIAFGSIVQTQRGFQQRELDDTAKEIFIAAQNHLSMADELGYTKRFSNKGESAQYTNDEGNSINIYYYAVGSDHTKLNDSSELLSQMLPVGSIDDTVRNTGTYIIRYNPDTATVMDVFFAWRESSSIFSAHTENFSFSDEDYDMLFKGEDPDYLTDSSARQDYKGQGIFIGYYGGDDAMSLDKGELNSPTVQIVNEERLYAIVTYESSASAATTLEPELDLTVTGAISGKTKTLKIFEKSPLLPNANNVWYVESNGNRQQFYVLLDDITKASSAVTFNKHFSNIFASSDPVAVSGEAGEPLLPGEDITIQASVHTKKVLARTKKSNRATSNSLFASVSVDSITNEPVARIANIRHLENLSGVKSLSEGTNNISSYNPEDSRWKGKAPTTARQVNDLIWKDDDSTTDDFCTKITEGDVKATNAGKLVGQAVSDETWNYLINTVQTTDASGSTQAINKGSFAPVFPKFNNFTYDGGSHRISDVNIDLSAGDAGLFGNLTFTNGGSVSNVALVDFNVKTENGSAGTLAGRVSDSVNRTQLTGNAQYTISNVAAYNSIDPATKTDDSSLEIKGTQSVGGLVGEMNGGSIYRCAAAVYVNSTAATGSAASTSTAGGLVGSASGVGIMQSYAGGHTSSRTVDAGTDQAKLVVEYLSDAQSMADKARGRLNVYATGAAGGLVGTATRGSSDSGDGAQTSVRQSYSTASVHGGTYSGGIIGSMGANAASITSSYTVGLVHADEPTEGASTPAKGVFVGNDPTFTGGTNAGNSYSELGCGMAIDNFDSAETSTATYRNIAGAMTQARPYDPSLSEAYKGGYPYKTIEELANITGAMTGFIHAHYGDWPVIETMVVNQVN